MLKLVEENAHPFSLLIHHRDGVEIVGLAPGARFLVGRVEEADISIPEPTMSRHHCRIEVLGEEVWIEDLDSSNGTMVNGAVVDRCRIRPGDDVALAASVTLSLHTPSHHARGLEHHARFEVGLEEELLRASTLHNDLALLLVRGGDGAPPFDEWAAGVRQVLRPVDRVGLHSAGTVEVLLPEADVGTARQIGQRVLSTAPGLRCGIALFPGPAREVRELLEAASEALGTCTEEEPLITVGLGEPGREPLASDAEDAPVAGKALSAVLETARRVARSDLPVLVVGETGAGKEVVAREIHGASVRAGGPMRCINCGALPRDLVQSILFGHERGSFTGANQQRDGVFQDADGGTLLLDEVGELPPEAQVALLRALETGRVSRLGSPREVSVNVRIVSATHRDLEAMCEAGTFRWDLYYRLNTLTLKVPPLRQRLDEIRELAELFVSRATRIGGLPTKAIDAEVFEVLGRYQWPGNVRELRNAMERATLVATGAKIVTADLPERVLSAVNATVRDDAGRAVAPRSDPTPFSGVPSLDPSTFKRKVLSYEIRLIRRALQRTGWNRTAAARQLRMPLRTLMHKIQTHGLKPPATASGGEEVTAARTGMPAEDPDGVQFKELIRRYESALIMDALTEAGWNKAEAARRLGLPLSTVLYKIKSHGLEDEPGRATS